MLDYLEKLRGKPVHTRKIILAATPASLTGIIFIIWLFYWAGFAKSLGGGISSNAASAQAAPPADLFKGSWRSFGGTLREGISEIKNQFKF